MHRQTKQLFALAGFVLAGCGAAAGQTPAADAATATITPWKAVATAGQVEAHPPAITEVTWRAVARGDLLGPHSTVRTGKRGRTTLARNGSILIVDRDSRVDLPSVVAPGGSSSVVQNQGRVVYKIDKADSKHFEVVTPYLVAGVKGTTFMVTVKDGTASVSVREGTVEVASAITGERIDVHAGESVLVGNQAETRMETVTLRPGEEAGRGRKSEGAERARDDAARMASLLDDRDAQGASSAEITRDPVRERTDTMDVDASGGLDALADGVKTEGGGRIDPLDVAIDPMRDPIDSLPVDSRSDQGTVGTDPADPGPGNSGPGNTLPRNPIPGGSGPGRLPGDPDPTDTTIPRLPTRS